MKRSESASTFVFPHSHTMLLETPRCFGFLVVLPFGWNDNLAYSGLFIIEQSPDLLPPKFERVEEAGGRVSYRDRCSRLSSIV